MDSNDKSKKYMINGYYLFITIILSTSIMFFCMLGYHRSTLESITVQHIELIERSRTLAVNDYMKARSERERNKLQKHLFETIKKLQPKLDSWVINHITNNILKECEEKRLDPILITALIYVESRFDPLAVSKKGAIGLMQIRYEIWKETPELESNGVDVKDKLFWVDLNISCGTSIFKKYYEEADKDIIRTLWRYNSGQTKLPGQFYDVDYANKILIKMYEIQSSFAIQKQQP